MAAPEHQEHLDSLLESAGKLICVGDFNINLLNTTSNAYVSMVESNGFTFLNRVDNDSATHGINPTGTIIDHAFTNIYYLNFGLCIDDISFTDHKSLLYDELRKKRFCAQSTIHHFAQRGHDLFTGKCKSSQYLLLLLSGS